MPFFRTAKNHGTGHRWSKTTPRAVADIRYLASTGVGNSELGRRFNLHRTTVLAIVRGDTWKGIEPSTPCKACGGLMCRVNPTVSGGEA